ncbi:MAG: 16S rRNA (cytosine(967)-C(5))-methyltransferase RsmB [Clostridium sp.]
MTKEPVVREIILDVLLEVLEKKQYSHVVLSQALTKYQYLEKQDRSFIKRIVDGTIEYLIQIDYILNLYSKVKVNKMKPVIRTLLRMSVYQICYMDRVPDSAVCNEAVKLAERRGFKMLKGFVNGVLRTISREKETIVFHSDSVRYSVPDWMLKQFKEQYSDDEVKRILESFLEEKPLTVRCNLNKATLEEIRASLQSQGVELGDSGYSEGVVTLLGVDYLERLDAFTKGFIQVQDLSSSLSGDAAGIRDGDYIIDVCGAPGGKSIHAAELLHGTGMVESRDISEPKVAMIEENIHRSGLKNIKARVLDALIYDADSEKKADVLIADLPCSGLGIIGRKPDIKYNMTLEKTEDLIRLQRAMLSVVYQYVKPGGTLIYSTCTINKKENEENIRWFLENFPFSPVNIEGRLGTKLTADTMKDGYIQLLPGIHPCDGFFIAVMKRNEM